MTIDAEIRVQVATAQLVRFHVNTPADNILRDEEMYWLDLCLTPRPRNARACYVDHWRPHRFERIGNMFMVPPGQRMQARSDGGPTQASILCHLRPQTLRQWFDGELEWTANRPTAERLDFRMSRPGHFVDVRADLAKRTAAITETRYNGWGVLRSLHTFNGVGVNAPRADRDWSLTKLWTFAMDAVAVGIIALVATSLILAYFRRDQWRASLIALGLGGAVCGLFVFGLRLL